MCAHKSFQHPGSANKDKQRLPPFLTDNDDKKQALLTFFRENLATLTCELVLDYINDEIITEMLKDEEGLSDR